MNCLSHLRLGNIVIVTLAYTLGAGISRFFGEGMNWLVFILGFFGVIALSISASFLVEYFSLQTIPLADGETFQVRNEKRNKILQISFAILSIFGTSLIILVLTGELNVSTIVFLSLTAVSVVTFVVPPFSSFIGLYKDLAAAIYIAMCLPAISFLLQADKFHWLLPVVTFPLALLAIAWMLAEGFLNFDLDLKLKRQNILEKLGIQHTALIHHILIISGYLLFGISPFMGISWGLIWPVFLAAPFSVLQIVWLQHISNGGKPLWKFFSVVPSSTFGLIVYLLLLSFWLR